MIWQLNIVNCVGEFWIRRITCTWISQLYRVSHANTAHISLKIGLQRTSVLKPSRINWILPHRISFFLKVCRLLQLNSCDSEAFGVNLHSLIECRSRRMKSVLTLCIQLRVNYRHSLWSYNAQSGSSFSITLCLQISLKGCSHEI